jgi:hypothetical protein
VARGPRPGGCFAHCGCACHIISKFLAGSMPELVGNPQEYVYIMSLSHLEQILESLSRSTPAYHSHLPGDVYGINPQCAAC